MMSNMPAKQLTELTSDPDFGKHLIFKSVVFSPSLHIQKHSTSAVTTAQQVSSFFCQLYHTLNMFFICNSTLGSKGKFIKLCKFST